MTSSYLVKRLSSLTLTLAILLNCFAPSIYPVSLPFSADMNHASHRDKHVAVPSAPPTLNQWNNNSASLLNLLDPTLTLTNDNFADAEEINGDVGDTSVDNTYATVEVGEPDHAGHAAGFSVWYRWQPTASGSITFDTRDITGSIVDTVIGVYTGSSLNALSEVASNDDVPSDIHSAVSFNATAGTVYYIALDVYDGAAYPGTLVLNWHSGVPTPTPSATNKIAFGNYQGVTMQLFVMNRDGSAQTRLTEKTDDSHAPVWSPDGTKLVFSTYRHGHSEIYIMDADGSNEIRLTNSIGSVYPSWSPDGTKIVFTSYDEKYNSDVFIIKADGTGLSQLSQDPTATSFLPSWSPDGTRIVFVSSRNDSQNIYVMNTDGMNLTRLTRSRDGAPVWSPDGTKIAFVRWGTYGSEIYVMNADGSNQTNVSNTGNGLPSSPGNYQPNWSPDGTKIAFASYSDGMSSIYVTGADGSNRTRLTATYDSYEPRWSPDGLNIGFISYRGDDQDIYLIDADGSNEVNLTNNSAYNGSFSWQPLPILTP